MDKLKLAVLGSTKGTDMEAIIEAINKGELNASIELVASNNSDAYILERARNHNLKNIFIDPKNKNREEYDLEILQTLEPLNIDVVLLIGYMKILSNGFIKRYKNKIINVHPSLLPAFAGDMDLNVHEEVLKSGVKVTGCTLHFVDEGVDTGHIITQKWFAIESNDTPETLKQKVQKIEGEAFVEVLKDFKNLNKNITQIKRALISVSDKEGVVDFARELNEQGVEIISTGGTAKTLDEAGIPVTKISDFTGFPEIMNGRVKTLHPLVHGGILGLRDKHDEEAKNNNIKWIDLVVCNLYPFSQTIQKENATEEDIIENIDIGGPTMIRSASKNIEWTTVVTDPKDYNIIIDELKTNQGIDKNIRKSLSVKAFRHTAQYDAIISNYFTKEMFPESKTITFDKFYEARYGENPHQNACIYKEPNNNENNILNAKIIQGKKLSYNNIGDADAALAMTKEFEEPCCVVVKHANPCGVATGENINEVFERAYNTDPLSAFGGVISLNRVCTKKIAESIAKVFAEIVLAPGYEPEALEILAQKKNLRVLELRHIKPQEKRLEFKFVEGGALFQEMDTKLITQADLKTVTNLEPTANQIETMLFAWKILKHIKSNGILIAKDNTTVGVGAGQVSRIDATDLAIKKGSNNVSGSVLASDAFFPFRDSIDKIAPVGIKAIIQPGGSIKDNEVIEACNEHNIAMVFTGARCFKH